MGRVNRRERLASAGQWLRAQRERRQLSAREVADRLNVLPQTVYAWEAGKSGVDDDRAEQIADLFGIPVLTTRRNLGLWVPPDTLPGEALEDGHLMQRALDLLAEGVEILDQLRREREGEQREGEQRDESA